MTGHVPDRLADWVKNPPEGLEDIGWEGEKDGERRRIGQGFEVEHIMTGQAEGVDHQWSERWLVIRSDNHAKKQQASFVKRLETVEKEIRSRTPKGTESGAEWQARLQTILEARGVSEFLTVEVREKTHAEKYYLRPGRPTARTPYRWETHSELSCRVGRQEAAIQDHQQRMGWRIYVTNAPKTRMTLQQGIRYYRDEYTVERGFHRFKRGSLPVLPLFLRIDERIKGLVFLLFIALQVLTLIDFVARRELAKTGAKLGGLVPGNPKIAVARPTAERLLSAFKGLHLLVEKQGDTFVGHLVEKLTPLQEKILSILQIPKEIYDLSFSKPVEDAIDLAMAA